MARIKRWYPVSHSFNRDPEVRTLRRQYGDWMGYVWQEMCSVADLNEGAITGTVVEIASTYSYISLWSRQGLAAKKIEQAFSYMAEKAWIAIRVDGEWAPSNGRVKLEYVLSNRRVMLEYVLSNIPLNCIFVVNYAKYHRTENLYPVPPEPVPEPVPEPDLIGKPKKVSKIPLPLDFAVTDAMREWAKENHLANPDELLEAFCDHHKAKASKFTDWEAAFRNWIRNDAKFNGQRKQHFKEDGHGTRTDSSNRVIAPAGKYDRVGR